MYCGSGSNRCQGLLRASTDQQAEKEQEVNCHNLLKRDQTIIKCNNSTKIPNNMAVCELAQKNMNLQIKDLEVWHRAASDMNRAGNLKQIKNL